jgi:hypothetical protein
MPPLRLRVVDVALLLGGSWSAMRGLAAMQTAEAIAPLTAS